jgi:hypothetical protein
LVAVFFAADFLTGAFLVAVFFAGVFFVATEPQNGWENRIVQRLES